MSKPGPATAPAGERRARGSLTRAEIAEVALALLDERGLQAVTMRQIAAALDVAVMSLYVHATNKDEILQAAADLVLADLPRADAGRPPREAVTTFFEGFHRKLLEHPSVAHTIASTPLLGEATFASMDSLFGVLTAAGLAVEAAVTAITELTSYTLGFALFSIARDRIDPALAQTRRAALLAIDPSALPHLNAAREYLLPGPRDDQFSDGLRRLVESLVPADAAQSAS
jgi:TetR/AcrR family transcriptional regulator, tetracycline repressor protein